MFHLILSPYSSQLFTQGLHIDAVLPPQAEYLAPQGVMPYKMIATSWNFRGHNLCPLIGHT